MSVRTTRRHAAATTMRLAVVAVSCLALAACNASDALPGSSNEPDSSDGATEGASLDASLDNMPTLSTNVRKGATGIPVSTLVQVGVENGVLTSVQLSSAAGQLSGSLADDGSSWTAGERLEPGTAYTVKAVAHNDDGRASRTTSFTTQDLSLEQQTYPSVAPLEGEKVGVGMPVIVTFDVAVNNRSEFERHMSVTSTPAQSGSWHWMNDNEAHWRPKSYWQSGTQVSVDVDVNGLDAGNGIYGQEDREVDFEVGDANIYKVNAQKYQMKVFSNGKLLRTIPLTTGKPGFITRSGIKVIIEKFESKTMNSETVGIPAGSAEAYNIDNVQWAMRLTYSGEFIHAAPWSVGSQGNANVSHGCTGLSTEDAGWLYAMSKRGDVVEYTGTDRPMEFENGYGDWNESFSEYAEGSAL